MDSLISRITPEMLEATACSYMDNDDDDANSQQEIIQDLQRQLSEVRVEVDRLKADLGWAKKEKELLELELNQTSDQVQIEMENVEQAYNAGVASERERCAEIADAYHQRDPVHYIANAIAEVIRRGE